MTQRKNTQGGFTLIELMIVVEIIGIIAAIALPAYGRYVERTHIGDGQRLLLDAAQWMERQYTVNNSQYPGSLDDFAGTSDFYTIAVAPTPTAVVPSQTYILTAAHRQGVKRGTTCNTMTLNHLGLRTGNPEPANGCWR